MTHETKIPSITNRSESYNPRQGRMVAADSAALDDIEEEYEVELGTYNPVQPLFNDHGISVIPLSSKANQIDHHILQILHHGTTAVLWEPEVPADKSAYVYLRLERSCGTISWHRPGWKQLKAQQGEFNTNYAATLVLILMSVGDF